MSASRGVSGWYRQALEVFRQTIVPRHLAGALGPRHTDNVRLRLEQPRQRAGSKPFRRRWQLDYGRR